MFSQINIIHFVIWAIAVGLIAAFIYTNTQRSALSVFINRLVERACLDEASAVFLSDLGLNRLQKAIVKNACFKHYGLKRIIVITKVENKKDSQEILNLFYDNANYKCHLITKDTNEILKKYSFKGMPAYQVLLFSIALILTAFLLTKACDLYTDYQNAYKSDEKQEELSNTENESKDNNNGNDIEQPDSGDMTENDHGSSNKPVIPTLPSIPTLPAES